MLDNKYLIVNTDDKKTHNNIIVMRFLVLINVKYSLENISLMVLTNLISTSGYKVYVGISLLGHRPLVVTSAHLTVNLYW